MIKNSSNINYSRALLELANENNTLDKVFNEMKYLYNTLEDNSIIIKTLKIPFLPKEYKLNIINKIFSKKISSKEIYNFITLLIKKNKESYLIDILNSFIDLYHNFKGIKKIELISTYAISKTKKENIISQLNLDIKKTILVEHIDKSLVGGFIIRYNGMIYDTSIKRKLNNLRNNINI